MIWGISSVGRAWALQVEGHEFESRILHRSNILRLISIHLKIGIIIL